jgi:hypothetical protein
MKQHPSTNDPAAGVSPACHETQLFSALFLSRDPAMKCRSSDRRTDPVIGTRARAIFTWSITTSCQ